MIYHGLRQIIKLSCAAALLAAAIAQAAAAGRPQADVAIVAGAKAGEVEKFAAAELANYLGRLYPQTRFAAAADLPPAGPAILVGCLASDPSLREHLGGADLSAPESFAVRIVQRGGREVAVVAGAEPRGTVFAVYALLEKLGCGFYLSFDAVPPASKDAFSFKGWALADSPLAADRIVFDWHNFLSGCSAWNLADWQLWTAQAQKMRFNTIMVHAYGNNPIFTFTFGGKTKPVGYLSSTVRGRDWGTEHVNDVRRLYGGSVFSGPIFGADAALAPEDRRADAAQAMMKQVFASAARRGMHVCFALDVDTDSANPQDLILALPENARFKTRTGLWLAAPDTPEGYAWYKAQAEALFGLYPQIDRLAIWIRTGGTPWTTLALEQLPARWQEEFKAIAAKDPPAAQLSQAAARFALGKVVAAFQRALKETGRDNVTVWTGSWSFGWLEASDRFFPPGIPMVALDYGVLSNASQLDTPERRADVRKIVARGRPVIPVVWAHHDDGAYVGRSFTPFEQFRAKLADCGATSFGIIHWTTRPLDLYFKSLSEQVWKASENQPLRATCDETAARCFGPPSREVMGEYLHAWVTSAPIFARETGDAFIDRPITPEKAEEIAAGCKRRLAMIDRVDAAKLDDASRPRLEYFRGLERFIADFFAAEALCQRVGTSAAGGKADAARQAFAECRSEAIVEQFARTSSLGGISRGEQGLVVAMNLKWLTYVASLRQALAIEPVRMNFAPTSHDGLAQGAGHNTFFADADKQLWRCYGAKEAGAAEFTLPEGAKMEAASGMAPASAEVCRTGIESDRPLALRIEPILGGKRPHIPKGLPPGAYRLRLLMADPTSTAEGQRVFDVTVKSNSGRGGGASERYTFEPVKAKFLRLLCHGSAENSWSSIAEVAVDSLDRAAVAKAVTASEAVAGFPAAYAVDGKLETRWAARGEGPWIQFPLQADAPTDHVDIAWYLGAQRQYKFDILVSADGRQWSEVAYKKESGGSGAASAARTERVDIFKHAGGAGRAMELTYPVVFADAGAVEVTLTPVTGKALICAAVLEPAGDKP